MKIFNINNFINSCNFEITPHISASKNENFAAANIQEKEIVDQLNKKFKLNNIPFTAVWSKNVKGWNSTIDRAHGDIYICAKLENGDITILKYIDLKVTDHGSKFKDWTATITRESFDEFSKYSNHLYLCMNSTGSKFILLDASRLKTTIELSEEDPWTASKYESNNREKDYLQGKWLNQMQEYIKAL